MCWVVGKQLILWAQSCQTAQTHRLEPTRLLSPWDFPGKDTGRGCHFLLQGTFPTQGSNLGLLHCRQILYLYRLSHREAHLECRPETSHSLVTHVKGEFWSLLIVLSWVSLLWITTLSNVIWNNLTCANAGELKDVSSIPGSGRSPGGGHGNPLQYSYVKNPMDRGVWPATVHRVAKSRTQLKQLSTYTKYWSWFWFLSLRKWVGGNSLVAQQLGLKFPLLRAWVPSLIRELGSPKFHSMTKKKKKKKAETNNKMGWKFLSLKFKNQNSLFNVCEMPAICQP